MSTELFDQPEDPGQLGKLLLPAQAQAPQHSHSRYAEQTSLLESTGPQTRLCFIFIFIFFFNFKIFNSYMRSQTWTSLPLPSP